MTEACRLDFAALFGGPPTVVGEAPGRVNLIGEHTDYNGGFVLPTVIPQRTRVELRPVPRGGDGDTVRAFSASLSRGGPEAYRLDAPRQGRGWMDYVQGVTWALADAGHQVRGFDLRVDSEVPVGSGLSSSAALEIALLRALRRAFALPLSDVELARLAQRAENGFVGAPVGIMDPMACSLALPGSALLLDTRDLAWERVPLPETAELVVIDSGVSHRNAAGEYGVRRAECEQACRLLGVAQLRDLAPADLGTAGVLGLPEILRRRVRHVVLEDERVLAAVGCLRRGDLGRLGGLLYEGHASLRDDYQVSVPELDLLVDLAREEQDIYGARLSGGGFGGAVVMVGAAGVARAAAERIRCAYSARTGKQGRVLVPAGTPRRDSQVVGGNGGDR